MREAPEWACRSLPMRMLEHIHEGTHLCLGSPPLHAVCYVASMCARVSSHQGSVILAKTLSIRYYTYYIILGINTTGIMGL